MSHEPDADRTVSVSDDDVRVEKSFARDEFPVPAIAFHVDSKSDEPAHLRLVDRIPDDFPMEGIGFHPDYESDNWTAYKDHRVEYERTLEPGDSVTTVYGIRLEEASDVAGFLREPILERPPVPSESPEDRPESDVEDVLGTDRSQLVRDALQGRGRLANRDVPREVESGLTTVVRRNDDAVTPVAASVEGSGSDSGDGAERPSDAEAGPDAYVDIGAHADSEAGGEGTRVSPESATGTDDTTPESTADGGLAATLAAEIRAGEVSNPDLETLRDELDGGLPRSADVRIRRLQSQMADLDTYTDALEEFIDEEGTGAELVERLGGELEDVSTELDALREGLDDVDATAETAVAGVEELHERADGVTGRLDGLEADLDEVADDVDDVAADVDDVDAAIGDVATDMDDVVADVDETDTAVSELDDEVGVLREDLAALSDELGRIDAIEDDIEQLQAFRDRLNSAFGPGGGGDEDGGE